MKVGIVGLPNVGKSTLFKALTKKSVDASNYPFCTIDPNVGVVAVPDNRLEKLSEISKSAEIIPTTIEFVDIAGLVKNAHKGEGLGNQFLSHIREVDAIVEVLRDFENSDITHIEGSINPERDKDIISLELIMADLETVNKRLDKISKDAKSGDKITLKILEILKRIKENLEQEKWTNELSFTDEEKLLIRDLNLLTLKPLIYVFNVTETEKQENGIFINAKQESELAELSEQELQELGVERTGLDKLIQVSYDILNLITFFTSGEKETRAWTVKKNSKAPQAAGKIHGDFEKGFIRAEVASYEDFINNNGWHGIKESGKMHLEGKDYEVQDGDVIYFHVN
jgi:ribosome-binding ATPase YchF (GTP1/OBG family)